MSNAKISPAKLDAAARSMGAIIRRSHWAEPLRRVRQQCTVEIPGREPTSHTITQASIVLTFKGGVDTVALQAEAADVDIVASMLHEHVVRVFKQWLSRTLGLVAQRLQADDETLSRDAENRLVEMIVEEAPVMLSVEDATHIAEAMSLLSKRTVTVNEVLDAALHVALRAGVADHSPDRAGYSGLCAWRTKAGVEFRAKPIVRYND